MGLFNIKKKTTPEQQNYEAFEQKQKKKKMPEIDETKTEWGY